MFGPVAELIETRRLVLAPLEAADAEEMAEVLGDPALHEFIGGAPLPLDELRARYERLARGPAPYHQEGWFNWTVRHRDHPIGYVQATVLPGPRASLAWVIGVPWQGHGYATEAAQGMVGWLPPQGGPELRRRRPPAGPLPHPGTRRRRSRLGPRVGFRSAPLGVRLVAERTELRRPTARICKVGPGFDAGNVTGTPNVGAEA